MQVPTLWCGVGGEVAGKVIPCMELVKVKCDDIYHLNIRRTQIQCISLCTTSLDHYGSKKRVCIDIDKMPQMPPRSPQAGGVAGTTVDVVLFPLDTLKTRLQSSRGFWKAGGFSRIYSGILPAAVGSAPSGDGHVTVILLSCDCHVVIM